ncbi:hypothetical protein ACSSS7_000760 [Eimeria intestinalis]
MATLQHDTDAGLPAKVSRRQSLRSTGRKNAASSVAALFLIAVIFTAFCKRLGSRVRGVGLAHRRLAEGGDEEEQDDELQAILESCLDYEQEASQLPGATLPPATGTPSLATSQAGLIASPHGTEPAGPLWPSSAPHWSVPLPPPPHVNPPAESPQPFPLLSGESVGFQSPPAEGASSAGFSFEDSVLGGPYPQLDPEAWLDQIPGLGPGAWLDQSPDIIGSVIEAPLAWSDAHESPKGDAQPSTSAATEEGLSGAAAQDSKHASHPYVRLPPLGPGKLRRRISVRGLRTGPLDVNANSTYGMLSAMRTLLAMREICPVAAEGLLQVVELIVCYARNRIDPGVTARPLTELVNRLGIYFLLFDAILAAYEILGPALEINTWWQDFASRFTIEYPEYDDYTPPRGQKRIALRNFLLVRRLQKALRQFKERKRPSNEEIIEIKRQLFFNKRYTFGHSRWNPWRDDDAVSRFDQYA